MGNINNGIVDGARRIAARVRELIIDGGLPGAPLGFRIRGATKSGPPAKGTWKAGDVVHDRQGVVWTCVYAGTPGRWAQTLPAALYPTGDTTGVQDTAMINAAIAALPAGGGVVPLAAGVFWTNAPIVLTSGVILWGVQGKVYDISSTYGTNIKGVSGWLHGSVAANALIVLGNGVATSECGLVNIEVDGTNVNPGTAGNMYCVDTGGNALNALFRNLILYDSYAGLGATGGGGTWRAERVITSSCFLGGFIGVPVDSTYTDCLAIANTGDGWAINNSINSKLIGCRAEWNGAYGFHVSGDGTATGGLEMIGCSTDRNAQSGLNVDSTGTWPLLVSGLQLRRDGSNATSAALSVAATATSPVIVDGLTIFPGFNDDGSGSDTPVTGISVASGATYVSVTGAMIHAVTTPVSGKLNAQKAVAYRTGAWNSPSAPVVLPDSFSGVVLGTTFNSGTGTAAQNVTGMAVTLLPGSYLLRGRFWYTAAGTTGSTQTFGFTFGGTATSALVSWQFNTAAYTAPVSGTTLTTSSGLSPTLTTTTYPLDWEAHVVVSAAGTLQLTVTSTTSGDEVSVLAGSYINVQQTAA
jgi:hypothetical protein